MNNICISLIAILCLNQFLYSTDPKFSKPREDRHDRKFQKRQNKTTKKFLDQQEQKSSSSYQTKKAQDDPLERFLATLRNKNKAQDNK